MPAIILVFNPPFLFMYLDDLFTTNIYFNMSLGSFGDCNGKKNHYPRTRGSSSFFSLIHQYLVPSDF